MKSVIIDGSISGISGNMILGALIDLGGDKEKIINLGEYLKDTYDDLRDIKIEVKKISRKGINSTYVDIKLDEGHGERKPSELISIINKAIEDLNLSEKGSKFALEILNKILEAEKIVHGKESNEIHLHETGSFDTIIDIVGTIILCEQLNLFSDSRWYGLPLAVGGGKVNFSHGEVSVPAPATLEILKNANYKIFGGPVSYELATPTGVAILTTLIDKQVDYFPLVKVKKLGYGGGSFDFKEVPNVLRIVIGTIKDNNLDREIISVIETNVDDLTGEVLGNLITNMMNSGKIKDINVIPTITKKNRPGYIIKITANIQDEEFVVKKLIYESGSLGIRIFHTERIILKRKIVKKEVTINNSKFIIPIKVSWNSLGVINYKPEFDNVKKIAEKLKLPVNIVLDKIIKNIDENDLI